MIKSPWLTFGASALVALGAYACSAQRIPDTPLTRAKAMITLSGSGADCTVKAKRPESTRQIHCSEIASYLRDTLMLPQGAAIAITALGNAADGLPAVSRELYMNGYPVSATISDRHSTPPLVAADTPAPVAADCDGVPPPCKPNFPRGVSMLPSTDALQARQEDGPFGLSGVGFRAVLLFDAKRYQDLDDLIARYARLQDRIDDGRFKLSGVVEFFNMTRQSSEDSLDKVQHWRAVDPQSPGAALLEADYWRNAAWRARGNGFANTVSPEGWRLFHERLERASQVLIESEAFAAMNPLWYTEALEVRLGLGAATAEQFALYERGIKAFPEYFPLHFQMLQALLPNWNGSNRAVREFIESVVKRSPPALQAQMYARLWWYVDESISLDVDVFRDVGASWPRMRAGFDSLNESYPGSLWNVSNYASFACRAGDVPTYRRLRAELGNKISIYAERAFPSNVSVDVCDDRAASQLSPAPAPTTKKADD